MPFYVFGFCSIFLIPNMGDSEATHNVLQKLLRGQELSYPWIISLKLGGKERERGLNILCTQKLVTSGVSLDVERWGGPAGRIGRKGLMEWGAHEARGQGAGLTSSLQDPGSGRLPCRLASVKQQQQSAVPITGLV